jgi:hypothetical protein
VATPQDDDLDKDALMDQLGDTPPTSNTMPVKEGEAAAATLPAVVDKPKYEASVFQGFTPKHAMEGFDFNREQNTGKSAKDAFAYLSQQAPPPPIQDKAALGNWFNQYIKPGMDALGHKVTNVEGDKFGFENWQGKFNVDYGRGAGAEGGALAWQVDDPSAVLSNQAYKPQMNPAQQAALGAAISGGGGAQGSDIQDQTRQQIEALIAGNTPPMDQQALLEQLQV